jgi:cytochrome c553
VAWAHTYTDEQSVLDTTCQNCHDEKGTNWDKVRISEGKYMRHAMDDRVSRQMMDKAETELYGAPFTTTDGSDGACQGCHGDESDEVSCNDDEWLDHLTSGRVTAAAFEVASQSVTGTTCGW